MTHGFSKTAKARSLQLKTRQTRRPKIKNNGKPHKNIAAKPYLCSDIFYFITT